MKFIGLVSGGKDSIYSICKLLDDGNTLVALLHIESEESYSDSYMYQTVGSELARLLGKCFDVPLYIFSSKCKTICKDLEYQKVEEDEVEDLFNGIKVILQNHNFEGISSGAIMSTYQKNRVEDICQRLGLESLAPLWYRNQKELLLEMINYGIDARIIKVASSMLDRTCLNMNLKEVYDFMIIKNWKYEINYCGEGGEFETAVLDCPYFKNRINVGSFEVIAHPEEKERENGVFYLIMKDLAVVPK